jgi:5-methylcytosine-specific restriction endonuclease McrA
MIDISQYPALLLNADWQPLTVHPLSTMSWQDAIKAVYQDRVTVVEEYDYEIHSERDSWRLPSVVALKDYVKRDMTPTFNRYNIYLRDDFTCQYCGEEKTASNLTFDHVLPRSLGGRSNWLNVVAACQPCNYRKAARTPRDAGMRLMKEPRQPTSWQLYLQGRHQIHDSLHETWRDYLYWDSALES